ncbi:MAG: type II toxin-antitoxin system VapC family toxin [Thermoanaerobaculia bacterium]
MAPRRKVYVETSVISYLTGRLSRDVRVAAAQRLTRLWWEDASSRWDLYISRLVVLEAGAGDPDASARRLAAIRGIPKLIATPECLVLAQKLRWENALPRTAGYDALHLAIAAVHGMDYLITWDRRHLASESLLPKIRSIIASWGYAGPEIRTPQQLQGGDP